MGNSISTNIITFRNDGSTNISTRFRTKTSIGAPVSQLRLVIGSVPEPLLAYAPLSAPVHYYFISTRIRTSLATRIKFIYCNAKIKSKARDFYKTFQPFISNKKTKESQKHISINVNGKVEHDQFKVAN